MLQFALYVSNHGFGHASRMSALAEELIKFGIYCHIRTNRPDHLFINLHSMMHQTSFCSLDFGVSHGKNFSIDLPETKSNLLRLMNNRPSLIEAEVIFLREEKIDLIIADIPFLVMEAALYANVPVFAISNFDWVFIYKNLFSSDKEIRPIINCIYGLYQHTDYSFRLPFGSKDSMCAFRKAEKIGLLARKRDVYSDLRKQFDIATDKQIILCMFGGGGTFEFDLKTLCKAFNGIVLSNSSFNDVTNHIGIDAEADFVDLTHGADIILTKPGYSTFAEATQFGKSIIYYERNNYPEESILIDGLAKYPYKIKLNQLDMSTENWKKVLRSLPMYHSTIPPAFSNRNHTVAERIIQIYFDRFHHRDLSAVVDIGTNNMNYCLFCDDRLLHHAHVKTGLGVGYKNKRISNDSLNNTRKAISTIMDINQKISSKTDLIATSISREASNISRLSRWIEKKYNTKYNVITETDELQFNYIAVQKTFPDVKSFIAFDLGGGSCEFFDENGTGFSLPIGLLKLNNTYHDHTERVDVFSRVLEDKFDFSIHGKKVIGIGLTALYLAHVVKKSRVLKMGTHYHVIHKQELEALKYSFDCENETDITAYMWEPENAQLLRLSTEIIILILDKIEASEFIVCEYGISLGFKYAKKKRKNK